MLEVVLKNRRNALRNPLAAYGADPSLKDLADSPIAFFPLSEAEIAPFADGSVVVVLASEERAACQEGLCPQAADTHT